MKEDAEHRWRADEVSDAIYRLRQIGKELQRKLEEESELPDEWRELLDRAETAQKQRAQARDKRRNHRAH